MTQVDFYILKPQASGDRYALACRIAEKAWQQGHRVLIHTASAEEARHVDRLLWTLHDRSFVPHGLLGAADPQLNPVLITAGQDDGAEHDVLINLDAEVPGYFSRFSRVAECVDHDAASRAASRARFRFYRDRGYPLQTHDIG
jgi:DNA polymerase-3 subunit chi